MKKIIAALAIVAIALYAGAVWANPEAVEEDSKTGVCPKTQMVESCLSCHTKPNFKLKEARPDEGLDYPVYGMYVTGSVMYVLLDSIDDDQTASVFEYSKYHPEVTKIVFELHSPGGSLLDAWRIVGYMNANRGRVKIETRCYGFAASAAFLVFASGDIGSRYVSPTAELMWHELWTFKMLSVETPSKSEDEAEVLRHLQNTTNEWIAERCNLTKEEVDAQIHKQEWWLNGRQAVEVGIADGLIGE